MIRFQMFIVLLISFHLNAQKEVLFTGSIYFTPRFYEDSLLSTTKAEKAFKKKFKQKLVNEIKGYDENPFKNDSVKRATLGVYIDSIGITGFKYERPAGAFKSSFIELFKKAIDSIWYRQRYGQKMWVLVMVCHSGTLYILKIKKHLFLNSFPSHGTYHPFW